MAEICMKYGKAIKSKWEKSIFEDNHYCKKCYKEVTKKFYLED